jgi:hypothetical protein
MDILAELILEQNLERGRRRSRSTTSRTSDAVAAQNQSAQAIYIEGEVRLSAVCGVAPPRRSALTTPSSSRLAYGLNSGFQCAHYLSEAQ